MAKKVIRLTEAKIAEMAVEVAMRMLKENHVNNYDHMLMQRDGDISRLTGDDAERMACLARVEDYKHDLDWISKDTKYTDGNPGALNRVLDYLDRCSNNKYKDVEELKSMMRVIKAYIKQYDIDAANASEERMRQTMRR